MAEPKEDFSPEKIDSIIEENRALHEENVSLRERLTYDSMTRLLRTEDEGRRTILKKIETIHGQRKIACLLRLDVNGLKPLNDASSHREVNRIFFPDLGKKLLDLAQKQDGVAMRYHGDEFGILVSLDSVDDTARIDSLTQELDDFYIETPGGNKEKFTFSIGIAREGEPEVKTELESLDDKEGELAEEGRIFTALDEVADRREREAKRKKKE